MTPSRRWQIGLAASATVLSAGGAAMSLLFAIELAVRGLHWVPWSISVGLAAPLMFAALGAFLRRRAGLTTPRVALFVALATAACWAGLAALLAWSAGFDAADEGQDPSGTTGIALVSVLAAWVLGSAAIASLLAALLPVPAPFLRRGVALLIGGVASIVGGAGVVNPGPVLVGSAVLLVLAVGAGRGASSAAGPLGDEVATRALAVGTAPSRVRTRVAAALAWTSAALGGAAAVFALTGSAWPVVTLDATRAMQVGIGVGDVAALPLVASVAILLRRPGPGIALSAGLLAVSLLSASAASFAGIAGGSDRQWNLLLASVAVAAVALALAVYTLVPGARARRVTIAVLCGIALPVTLGIPLLAAAAFVLPPAAVAWAVWGVRAVARPRRDSSPQPLPQRG